MLLVDMRFRRSVYCCPAIEFGQMRVLIVATSPLVEQY
jgi:hypothetical protein